MPDPPFFTLPELPDIDQPDLIMRGFHGTRADLARKIVDEQRMLPSTREWEWLGHGIYFWEDDPARAFAWAQDRYRGEEVAVVQARIRRGTCLNLQNSTYRALVAAAERRFVEEEARAGRSAPENRGRRSDRDCAVLNFLYDNIDKPIDTIHASFPEGRMLYEDSRLRELTHVQICVRNTDCILRLSLSDLTSIDPKGGGLK